MPGWKKCIGYFGIMPGWNKRHLTGCIGEIIAFYKALNNQETSYIHEYLMKSGELPIQSFRTDVWRSAKKSKTSCIQSYLGVKLLSLVRHTTKVIPFKSGEIGQLWASLGK